MSHSSDAAIVLLAVENSQGYSADQVSNSMTAGALYAALGELIREHGEDVVIVTKDQGNMYGANYGAISTYADTFTLEIPDCDVCGAELQHDEHDPECPKADA